MAKRELVNIDDKIYVTTVIEKGGPGSGRYPAGSGSHPSKTSTSFQTNFNGKAWAYHGTSMEAAQKILEEGITKHKASIGDRPESVYFMQDAGAVREYVKDVHLEEGKGYAIVKFEIPKDAISDILDDEEEGDSFRIEQSIPKEWITEVNWYDSNDDWISEPPTVNKKQRSNVGYVLIVVDKI